MVTIHAFQKLKLSKRLFQSQIILVRLTEVWPCRLMEISYFGVERRWDICGRCNVNPKVRNKTVSCRLSDFVFGLFLACETFCLICGASMLVCFKGLRFSLPSAPFVFPQSFQRVIEGLMPHSFAVNRLLDLHHFLTYQWFPSCFYARYILLFPTFILLC
mgnify:CR=1 FL=1